MYNVKLQMVVCDLHSDYLSSNYAQELSVKEKIPVKKVQHHHAHIAACLFENKHAVNAPKILGVSWDGSGLGADNNIWGGEFLLADYSSFQRLAHFEYTKLLGGDKASQQPWRMTYAYLQKYNLLFNDLFKSKPVNTLRNLFKSDTTVPLTSSVGRLFDAVAYMLGICTDVITYEGQAAMELEALACKCHKKEQQIGYSFAISSQAIPITIGTKPMWIKILEDLRRKTNIADIAYRFHISLAELILCIILLLSKRYNFDTVALSGGVFNNKLLSILVYSKFQGTPFKVITPANFPVGDGGISLGQIAISMASESR